MQPVPSNAATINLRGHASSKSLSHAQQMFYITSSETRTMMTSSMRSHMATCSIPDTGSMGW